MLYGVLNNLFLNCKGCAKRCEAPKLFGFLSAILLQGPNHLVSRLQHCCKAQTVWFLICGTSARPKPFGFSFAGLPRGSNHLVFHLRNFREAQTIWFLICGTSARPKLFSFSFAGLPQTRNRLFCSCAHGATILRYNHPTSSG